MRKGPRSTPLLFDAAALEAGRHAERFSINARRKIVLRHVSLGDGTTQETSLSLPDHACDQDAASAHDIAWLSSSHRPSDASDGAEVPLVDLFSGCGGLTLGVWEACRAIGLRCTPVVAVDFEAAALETYGRNFPSAKTLGQPIEELIDGKPGDRPSCVERAFLAQTGGVRVLVGGPPCQGHSDLNNHTRRDDPKNALYLTMARAAELLRPDLVIIENVPAAVHDRSRVVFRARDVLDRCGYKTDAAVLSAVDFGVPQTRKRHFLVGASRIQPDLAKLPHTYGHSCRSISWACSDLLGLVTEETFDSPAVHSADNVRRINYLFDHDLYDLPNEQRPDCHRLKDHSYKAVYGRLYWDRPVGTITSGFGSTGQGRFVHPKERRTLTPHEAARLQFFPDFFRFGAPGRRSLQSQIGNAVPSKLSYVVALDILRRVVI